MLRFALRFLFFFFISGIFLQFAYAYMMPIPIKIPKSQICKTTLAIKTLHAHIAYSSIGIFRNPAQAASWAIGAVCGINMIYGVVVSSVSRLLLLSLPPLCLFPLLSRFSKCEVRTCPCIRPSPRIVVLSSRPSSSLLFLFFFLSLLVLFAPLPRL